MTAYFSCKTFKSLHSLRDIYCANIKMTTNHSSCMFSRSAHELQETSVLLK